jgi:excisionase family DNA binding protein
MYVNVQRAAARLGVSVVTIRRWTASGFLPCTRTPGCHRRFNTDDLDELARQIGGNETLAAKAARERELETVVSTAIAFGSRLDLPELLAEISRQVTRILDTDYCTLYEYDPNAQLVRTLADYDRTGRHWPTLDSFLLADYPLTRRVIDEQMTAIVDANDPAADPAEVATLRLDNDASMLMVPIVHQGTTIGMLETIDHERSRQWQRQELRLVRAVANQAGMAIANAHTVAEIRSSERELESLRHRLALLKDGFSATAGSESVEGFLNTLARTVCEAFAAVSCVVAAAGHTAGASGAPVTDGEVSGSAHVVTARDPSGETDLALTLTLDTSPSPAAAELIELIVVTSSPLLRQLLKPSAVD